MMELIISVSEEILRITSAVIVAMISCAATYKFANKKTKKDVEHEIIRNIQDESLLLIGDIMNLAHVFFDWEIPYDPDDKVIMKFILQKDKLILKANSVKNLIYIKSNSLKRKVELFDDIYGDILDYANMLEKEIDMIKNDYSSYQRINDYKTVNIKVTDRIYKLENEIRDYCVRIENRK